MEQQARELILQVRQSADQIRERVRQEQLKTNHALSQMNDMNVIVNAGYVHGELPIVAKDVQQGGQGGLFYVNPRGNRVYLSVTKGQKQQCLDGTLPGALSGCN